MNKNNNINFNNNNNINKNMNPIPPVEPVDFSNSHDQKWWDEAASEIDSLIDKAKFYMGKKNVNLNNLYKKYEKLFAGHQSTANCWLFSSQNVANYFLDLDGQAPIKKIEQKLNGSRDIVEQEFIKHQPGKANLLHNAQTQDVMRDYLNTYKINIQDISIFNYKPNDKQREKLMEKFVYFLLVQHFSNSDVPVIVNVGFHWITIAGIDVNKEEALVLDSLNSTPDIRKLSWITSRVAKVKHHDDDFKADTTRITMLCASKHAANDDIWTNFPGMNWNTFKSRVFAITNQQ